MKKALAVVKEAYHHLVPYSLRRDLWYRRVTGQSYRQSLPPVVRFSPEDVQHPIHEVVGPDIVVVAPLAWEALPPQLTDFMQTMAQRDRRVFFVTESDDGLPHSSNLHSVTVPDLTQATLMARLSELRERFSCVDCLCLLSESASGWREAIAASFSSWRTVVFPDMCDAQFFENSIDAVFPSVKLIMLTYNNLDFTQLAVRSILEKTRYPRYDILLVDNASEEPMRAVLRSLEASHPRIHLIENEQNLGFAGGMNVGIHAAPETEVVVLLNDDIIVTPGWLSTLVGYLADKTVGIVGPTTSYTSNEARIPIAYHHVSDIDQFAFKQTTSHQGDAFEVGMFPFFCAALRMETIADVGPLDERFRFGMFEDDDYAQRLHNAGYRILCARDAFVHHFGGTSFNRLKEERLKEVFQTNQRLFEEKWQMTWTPQWRGHVR